MSKVSGVCGISTARLKLRRIPFFTNPLQCSSDGVAVNPESLSALDVSQAIGLPGQKLGDLCR